MFIDVLGANGPTQVAIFRFFSVLDFEKKSVTTDISIAGDLLTDDHRGLVVAFLVLFSRTSCPLFL